MPKRRPGLPKVKTGCYTCKFRRVKCGEEQPICQRCAVFGVTCEGYPEPIKNTTSEFRQLVPRGAQPKVFQQLLQLNRNPYLGSVMTDEEHRYFRFFCDDLAKGFGAPYHASVWETVIPQMGEVEPFIRHATVALGALKKSNAVMNQKPILTKNAALLDPHHIFAVVAYCKALKGIREAMTQNRGSVKSALVTSLLAFCFESLEGHEDAATSHAAGGTTLFHKWQNEKSASNFLEMEDLVFAFSGLDLQVLVFVDDRPVDVHKEHLKHLNKVISQMPAEFTDLMTCRNYIQLIVRRNLHFRATARATKSRREASQTITGDELSNITHLMLKPKFSHESNGSSGRMTSELVPEQRNYIEDVSKWEQASARLFKATGSMPSDLAMGRHTEDFVITNTLKIQSIASTVSVHRTYFRCEAGYDSHLADFRMITELSAQIYPLLVKTGITRFRFHVGILPALGLVVMHCRDRHVRLQALEILLSCPGYQEGVWDSIMFGKIGEAHVNLEEPWRTVDGDIPDNRRAIMVNINMVLKEKRMTASFWQRVGTDDVNDVVKTKQLLTW